MIAGGKNGMLTYYANQPLDIVWHWMQTFSVRKEKMYVFFLNCILFADYFLFLTKLVTLWQDPKHNPPETDRKNKPIEYFPRCPNIRLGHKSPSLKYFMKNVAALTAHPIIKPTQKRKAPDAGTKKTFARRQKKNTSEVTSYFFCRCFWIYLQRFSTELVNFSHFIKPSQFKRRLLILKKKIL